MTWKLILEHTVQPYIMKKRFCLTTAMETDNPQFVVYQFPGGGFSKPMSNRAGSPWAPVCDPVLYD